MASITQLPIQVHRIVSDPKGDADHPLRHRHSWIQLVNSFTNKYGEPPTHVVAAPGRVNIIGEHIDYALFGVLPAAIENQMAIALRATPDSNGTVQVSNVDSKYTDASFSAFKDANGDWTLAMDPKALRWESYVKAGYLGVLERFFPPSGDHEPVGMDALFTSTIPAGSGVSSSAALIVASTLAFLVINEKLSSVTKGDLVSMSVGNEKKVGVNRMDQSASILSTPGNLLYISFHPTLQPFPITLPSNAENPSCFVIANSLTTANKAETAKTRYNLRVVETLVGARILSRVLGLEIDPEERVTYRQVLERWWKKRGYEDNEDSLKDEIKTLLDEEHLEQLKANDQDGVLLAEMVEKTGLDEEDFCRLFLSWVEVEATYFQLYRRALHVFTEALRVLEFRDLCRSVNASSTLLDDLGRLMNESQQSCARLYECSSPGLDTLTSLARASGAYGSRLTGAGWGGCTVSLVKTSEVHTFMAKLKRGYPPYQGLNEEEFNVVCFATKPANGACVFEL